MLESVCEECIHFCHMKKRVESCISGWSGSASNYPHSSVILRKLGLKYGIRKSSSKYGKVGINWKIVNRSFQLACTFTVEC